MSCPKCGKKSLCEIVEHSCKLCAVVYEYCPACLAYPDVQIALLCEGIDHEEDCD